MSDNKYIELLNQYRTGSISNSDRHILEQAALDDPFLFDAMEGYGISGGTTDQQAIEDLKKLPNKDSKILRLNRKWMGIAASLIALLAITFLVKNSLDSDARREAVAIANNTTEGTNKDQIAQAIPEQNDDNTPSSSLENNVDENTEVIEESITESKKVEKLKSSKSNTSKSRPIKSSPQAPESTTKEIIQESKKIVGKVDRAQEVDNGNSNQVLNLDEIAEEEMVVTEKEKSIPNKAIPSNKRESKPEEDAISYAETEDDKAYILGKVLDANGQELMGATVYIDNTEIGDVSDIEGNFKLPKYERGHQMVISYTGYKDQKILLGDVNYYQVVLQPKENLSEVKVIPLKEVGNKNAFPAMGLDEFDIYLQDNIRHPLEAFGSPKSKNVVVGFDVGMNGKLSNFVDKSNTCDACFKEAIRLLKGSGRWETKPFGTAYRTSYEFEF